MSARCQRLINHDRVLFQSRAREQAGSVFLLRAAIVNDQMYFRVLCRNRARQKAGSVFLQLTAIVDGQMRFSVQF